MKPLPKEFLLSRGSCCKNGCKNCPYGYNKNKNMNITIYTIAYNEEFMLPFFIKWYKERFPDCKIVVYDNYSTDNTVQIALDNNCEVIQYDTNNQLSDSKYLEIKNNCWKDATTDWVIVCDVDELLDINSSLLNTDQTLFKSKGYNMCNVENIDNILDIKYGIESPGYDKTICFNKKYIKEINYSPGCHSCNPKGDVIYGQKIRPILLHMKFINEDLLAKKYKSYKSRLSAENLKNNWGFQYKDEEEKVRESYKNHLKIAKNIYGS